MRSNSTDATMAELVRHQPRLTAVFNLLGLDYCCRGERTLTQAAAVAGVDLTDATEAIEAVLASAESHGHAGAGEHERWPLLGPAALADHIEAVHHARLRSELPVLEELAAEVESVHGHNHPELSEVRHLVGELRDDLLPHLAKEERVLFPAIRALCGGASDVVAGALVGPIEVMTAEHERTGKILAQVRVATNSYRPPSDACAKVTTFYQSLERLEADTHLHVFKENSVLFPAATQMVAATTSNQPSDQ